MIVRYFTKRTCGEIDTDKFTQVVDNIMNNAVKYYRTAGSLPPACWRPHNHVILSISDQGWDSKKDLGHILTAFFQGALQGGTGLGYISKEVVNLLGWQSGLI